MAEKNKMKIRRRLWAGLEQVEGMSICCDMSRFSGTLYSEEAFYYMNLRKTTDETADKRKCGNYLYGKFDGKMHPYAHKNCLQYMHTNCTCI